MAGMFFVAGIDDMLAINRTEEKNVRIEIPANPNLDTVATVLEKNNIIDDKNYFKLFAKFTKADDDFTQGTYDIKTNLDYEAIINFLLSSVNRTDTVEVTIPEGRNVLEIAKLLKEKGALADEDKFLELCNSNHFDDEYSFLRILQMQMTVTTNLRVTCILILIHSMKTKMQRMLFIVSLITTNQNLPKNKMFRVMIR